MNDTESLSPTGSEPGAVSRLPTAGLESGETAPPLLVYRSRSELLTVPQWREIAALARHATIVPRVYSEGVRTPFEKWRPQDIAAECPHEPGRHR